MLVHTIVVRTFGKFFYIFWKKKIHDATRIVESKFRLFCILREVIYLRNLKFEKSKFLEIFFFFSLLKIPNLRISCFQIQRKNFVESKTFSWFQTFFGKIAIDLSVAERFFNKIFNKFNGIYFFPPYPLSRVSFPRLYNVSYKIMVVEILLCTDNTSNPVTCCKPCKSRSVSLY